MATDEDRVLDERRAAAVRIPLHDLLGLEWEVPPEGARVAVVAMPVRPEAFGFTANLHGGAIATLVDVACALAAARASGFDPLRQSLVTADIHLRYLGRARTDRVEARAEVVKVGRQLIVVNCRVTDSDGNVVALADFSSMIVPLRGPLNPALEVETAPGAPEL
jgi:uncharacterized protein (TIGR00369 family)